MTTPTFAELLRRHRDARGLSQARLASLAHLNEETVRELERGGKRPRNATVGLLADALALDADQRAALREAATGGRVLPAGEGPRPRGGLRLEADSFVGREQEVILVRRRLEAHRLVTLTGPGGVGKTRLAVEAAHRLADASVATGQASHAGPFPDGVWLAELGPLADPDLVPNAVAVAVGATLDPDAAPGDALAEELRPRRLLLVLDNCEHLVDACAALVETLLGACPGVRVLATSRESLGCAGEAVVRVPSLALPPLDGVPDPAEIGDASAVRLFVDRAGEVAPGFALTARTAPAVAEVCRRLDGIPLALEFAAKLLRGLPVEEVAARLDDRFRLLTGGRRTALGRQQTLRALVDWSYDLLAPDERALFVRLSVFAGTFSLEAAEAVCGRAEPDADANAVNGTGASPPPAAVLSVLLRLVDTSFVLAAVDDPGQERQNGATHYRLLETLREYGRERLVADAAAFARLRDRHLAYHLGLVEAAATAGAAQAGALRRLEAARDDLWAALGWARDREDAGADRRLGDALARLADQLTSSAVRHALTPLLFETRRLGLPAYATVATRLLEQADPVVLAAAAELYWVIGDWPTEEEVAQRRQQVEEAGHDAIAVARAQLRGVRLLVFRNGLPEALRRLDALADVAEVHGDDEFRLDVLLERGYTHWHTGDCAPGRQAYADALELLECLRPSLGEAAYRAKRLAALRGSGLVAHNADDNVACLAFQTAALTLARETHDHLEEVMARANRADAEWGCREYGRALRAYNKALADPAAFVRIRHVNVLGRGIVLSSIGRYEEAARLLTEGVAVCRDIGDVWLVVWGLVYLGAVHAGQGHLTEALAVSGEAVTLAERHGVGYPISLARAYLLWQEEVRAPGHPEHAPRIEEALTEARRLELRGLAAYLAWVRLLHRTADPTVSDDALEGEVADAVRLYRACAPIKGAWELLGLQVLCALGGRRPAISPSAVAAVEVLVAEEMRVKALSLDPDDRQDYRTTRRCWEAGA